MPHCVQDAIFRKVSGAKEASSSQEYAGAVNQALMAMWGQYTAPYRVVRFEEYGSYVLEFGGEEGRAAIMRRHLRRRPRYWTPQNHVT
ncbi:hypothetical protein GCM10010841_22770 [Deinococcus aerophilus]|uniref:Uncharacterized protein n=1 Tax=Deinococcus aerophilus TaxID=522488 RepID=A0ABQ2GU70_9DEIO|nr:hypothetical protein GCM10010841_22770 [Deinococcus aerophilus]